MKTILCATLLSTLPVWAAEPATEKPAVEKAPVEKPAPAAKPRIEVCFVLDTTGSMGGLIEGAKQKIWSIANDIIAAKPTPDVRFGLVGYRDRGDEYVLKRADLTDDLDAIHAKLKEFTAGGGGDMPESVSEALDEAVQKMEWSKDRSVLKIIYLVGDAPPQQYKDGKDWRKVCESAVKADLLINTVQCGNVAETTKIWQAIASRGEGSYVALPQSGNMVVVATPQDKELAELSIKIGDTLIPWGDDTRRRAIKAKQEVADRSITVSGGISAAPASVTSSVASRASYNWKSGKAVQGDGELIDAISEGKVKLETVKASDLPEDLRKLSPEELQDYVAKKKAEREGLQKQIAELSKKRDAYLETERTKAAKDAKTASFDSEVAHTLRKQAKKKGIRYE